MASSSASCPPHASPRPLPCSAPAACSCSTPDGITEARTGEDHTGPYGNEALLAFAADHAGKPPPAAIQALTGLLHSFGDGLDDDTALLALGVPAPNPRTRSSR
ncbi:hypothetical protein BFF78_05340 [Streptomyces fodineus]|uniref:PPM-type phosphatase domain-containing protein n=1 Tax=Streptomyces fodineus TaxID=1904616 RepID=A0A1D7Y4M6_9ACTN|nr:hypothetical protein BFF78_05340 [Streptomyces fodineus]